MKVYKKYHLILDTDTAEECDCQWEERNLDKKLDGIVITFADLGFWDGRKTGARVMGRNLNSILNTCGCDTGEFFTNNGNVKANLHHHDGTQHLTFRLVSFNKANKIMDMAHEGKLTWEYFRRNSKSLIGFLNEIYGWS